jgi:hypothetical protein
VKIIAIVIEAARFPFLFEKILPDGETNDDPNYRTRDAFFVASQPPMTTSAPLQAAAQADTAHANKLKTPVKQTQDLHPDAADDEMQVTAASEASPNDGFIPKTLLTLRHGSNEESSEAYQSLQNRLRHAQDDAVEYEHIRDKMDDFVHVLVRDMTLALPSSNAPDLGMYGSALQEQC